MKKIFCLVMAVALVCGTLLTGCGRYSDADPTDTTTDGVIGDGIVGDGTYMDENTVDYNNQYDYAGAGYPNAANDMDTAARSGMRGAGRSRTGGKVTEYTSIVPSANDGRIDRAVTGK